MDIFSLTKKSNFWAFITWLIDPPVIFIRKDVISRCPVEHCQLLCVVCHVKLYKLNVMGEWVAFAVAPIHTFIPNGTNHIECHYWLAILVDNIRRWGNFVILDMSDTTYSHNKNHRQLMMMHISLYNEIKYMFRANSETVSSITTALQYLILALFRKCPPQSGAQPKERSRHKRISIYKYHHSTLSAT